MSPNRLEATITSNVQGLRTRWAARASTSSLVRLTSGYERTVSSTISSQNGMVCTMPLLLVADVRCPRREAARPAA
jgi:hypothetical protein